MIKIPFEQIVAKIKEESDLDETKIQEKIDAKMKQLSGLISKEGAAHIIANELGIKLVEVTSGMLQIKNIASGLRNVETAGKVMRTFPVREFNSNGREGKVASVVLADSTGSIRLVMWGDQAELVNQMSEGTIVKVHGSYVKDNNNSIEMHANERTQIVLNPADVKIESTVAVSGGGDAPRERTRKAINQLAEDDYSVEILGTIVQVFDPRFFAVDPATRKKLTEKEGVFYLNDDPVSNPEFSYVMNAVIDDGNDTIRAVFFKEAMQKLTSQSHDQILTYREALGSFEAKKTDLLGTIVKLQGKVKKNIFFDRIEFVAFEVDLNPNPQDEMARLETN